MPKRKILFVVDDEVSFSRAPSSRLLYIARVLKQKNFKVEVIGRRGEEVDDLNITQLGGTKHLARLKILLYTYIKTLIEPYDSVVVRGILFTFPLLPLKIVRKKMIFDFHGFLSREIRCFYEKTLYNKLKGTLYYFLERMAVKYSDIVICCSRGIMDLLGEDEKRKSILLENGLDVNEAERVFSEAEHKKKEIRNRFSIPENKSLIGFLGNWERHLDMKTMFKGAEIAGVSMVVIGEGPKLNEFKRRWKNARFTGRLPRFEALKIICLCNATIMPYEESYGYASYFSTRKVKDYLSLGKPIIMTDVREKEAYLLPNKNVLLYELGNAEDLAEKIRKLLSDKKLQKRMKTNNIKLSHCFDWKILVQESGIIELIS